MMYEDRLMNTYVVLDGFLAFSGNRHATFIQSRNSVN